MISDKYLQVGAKGELFRCLKKINESRYLGKYIVNIYRNFSMSDIYDY